MLPSLLSHVLKPGTPQHRNTGTLTNKVSFVFALGLELMVSGERLVIDG